MDASQTSEPLKTEVSMLDMNSEVLEGVDLPIRQVYHHHEGRAAPRCAVVEVSSHGRGRVVDYALDQQGAKGVAEFRRSSYKTAEERLGNRLLVVPMVQLNEAQVAGRHSVAFMAEGDKAVVKDPKDLIWYQPEGKEKPSHLIMGTREGVDADGKKSQRLYVVGAATSKEQAWAIKGPHQVPVPAVALTIHEARQFGVPPEVGPHMGDKTAGIDARDLSVGQRQLFENVLWSKLAEAGREGEALVSKGRPWDGVGQVLQGPTLADDARKFSDQLMALNSGITGVSPEEATRVGTKETDLEFLARVSRQNQIPSGSTINETVMAMGQCLDRVALWRPELMAKVEALANQTRQISDFDHGGVRVVLPAGVLSNKQQSIVGDLWPDRHVPAEVVRWNLCFAVAHHEAEYEKKNERENAGVER